MARGEATPYSDVDLLVVTADKASAQAALEEQTLTFLERYGNVLSFTLFDLAEFRRRYRKRDDFLREATGSGYVITGQSPMELVYGSS